MRRSPSWMLPIALILFPMAVRAADVPVSYTVDDRALGAAISGTVLTFQLYSDAACTQLTHMETPTIDAVTIVSRLKRFTPHGGTKPPKTAELRTTLTGVSPSAATYLKVTGTGVTPVGGTCQVQAFTAPGAASGSLVLKDANGATLGPFDSSTGDLVLDDAGVLIQAFVQPSGFFQGAGFFYTSTDCSGPQVHIVSTSANGFLRQQIGVLGTSLYYFPDSGTSMTINSSDTAPTTAGDCTGPGQVFIPPDRCCCTPSGCWTAFATTVGPVGVMDVSGFTPPFHAEIP